VNGNLTASDWRKLMAAVSAERADIENAWAAWMIVNDWLKADLVGSVVTLTAYPGTRHTYIRTLDLREIFRGAYPEWDDTPPHVELDKELGAFAVGRDRNPWDRNHLRVGCDLFID
jgi:hypothetical protein